MFLDARIANASACDQRYTFYHELFHLLNAGNRAVESTAWIRLNPPGFVYPDNALAFHGFSQRRARRCPGFVTSYARSSVEEDMAELFASLIVKPAETAEFRQSDRILAAKAELLMQSIGTPAAWQVLACDCAPDSRVRILTSVAALIGLGLTLKFHSNLSRRRCLPFRWPSSFSTTRLSRD
jgi:hypothetical protein